MLFGTKTLINRFTDSLAWKTSSCYLLTLVVLLWLTQCVFLSLFTGLISGALFSTGRLPENGSVESHGDFRLQVRCLHDSTWLSVRPFRHNSRACTTGVVEFTLCSEIAWQRCGPVLSNLSVQLDTNRTFWGGSYSKATGSCHRRLSDSFNIMLSLFLDRPPIRNEFIMNRKLYFST